MRLIAYIDAGTGSMLVSAILGGAAGLMVFLKSAGRRLFHRDKATTISES